MTAWDYALWVSIAAVLYLIGKGVGFVNGYKAGKADAAQSRFVVRLNGATVGSVGITGFSIEPGSKIDVSDGDY